MHYPREAVSQDVDRQFVCCVRDTRHTQTLSLHWGRPHLPSPYCTAAETSAHNRHHKVLSGIDESDNVTYCDTSYCSVVCLYVVCHTRAPH